MRCLLARGDPLQNLSWLRALPQNSHVDRRGRAAQAVSPVQCLRGALLRAAPRLVKRNVHHSGQAATRKSRAPLPGLGGNQAKPPLASQERLRDAQASEDGAEASSPAR